ncbi:YtxH domain-containing protein [Ureibacillus composti]
MSESKLLKSVIIGALTGAALSMLDRKTREHTIESAKKMKDSIIYYSQNYDELREVLSEKLEEAQELYEKTSENVSLIASGIEELKDMPSTVQGLVEDTRNAFSQKEDIIH